jgi:hypothetical protein
LGHLLVSVTPPLVKGLAFLGTDGTKEAFVQILRQIFADKMLMEETYLYQPPENEQEDLVDGGGKGTKIRIYRAYPQRIVSYPAIIVSMGSFDGGQRYMGQERGEMSDSHDAQGNLAGRDFGGYDIMPVEITVHSRLSPRERDRLVDILRIALQLVQRSLAFRFGLSYVHVNVSGDAQAVDGRDEIQIHSKTLTLQCQNDYNWFLSQDQAELVNSILLKVAVAVSKADPGQFIPPVT